jgi:acetyltransferase-like isoleucine patch superfamily enzyme
MKNIFRVFVDFIFFRLLPPFFLFYEKHFFYRFRQSFGKGILLGLKNKGKNIKIHGHCTIIKKDKLIIEDDVRIGNNCYFFAMGGIKICSNAQISRNVVIYSANHNYEGKTIPYDDSYIEGEVVVGSSSWIGMNVCILPGVTIGRGAIIGMGSIVTKSVPDGAIAAGNPAKVIKYRNMEHFTESDLQEMHFGKLYKNA